MSKRGDANFLEVVARESVQQLAPNIVRTEQLRVLRESYAFEPTVDIHGLTLTRIWRGAKGARYHRWSPLREGPDFLDWATVMLDLVRGMPTPVIAAVNGRALGWARNGHSVLWY